MLAPIPLFRAIGRRPSSVSVDDQRRPVPGNGQGHRLWDLVFEECEARPGDQLQDRQGSIVLVTKDGQCSPVQLSPPHPRNVATAFTHADKTLSADWAVIDRLLADGRLAVGSIRRTKQAPFNPAQVKFDETQPLVTARAEG